MIFDDKDVAEINKILWEINNKYNGTGLAAKTGEIFPTDTVPILSRIDGKPSLSLMKWGFPKWDGTKGVIINAKSETAAEKRTFAKPLRERRCVIPSTGFYEWSRDAKGRTKDEFLFSMDDDEMLYMAGFYTEFKEIKKTEESEKGEVIKGETIEGEVIAGEVVEPLNERFVILTCAANGSMSDIHDRMPVILRKNELTRWLADDEFVPQLFQRDTVQLVREAVKAA